MTSPPFDVGFFLTMISAAAIGIPFLLLAITICVPPKKSAKLKKTVAEPYVDKVPIYDDEPLTPNVDSEDDDDDDPPTSHVDSEDDEPPTPIVDHVDSEDDDEDYEKPKLRRSARIAKLTGHKRKIDTMYNDEA